MQQTHVITGAYGYSGRYIARKLLQRGVKLRTVTNSIRESIEFEGKIETHPQCFDDPQRLHVVLEGASVLYNTYWVRFNYRNSFTHSLAVENTLKLFEAAKKAGVTRIVHTSITNPDANSHLEYFAGKAVLEKALKRLCEESGMSYAILRPTVLFGKEDILINNIAWLLRTFPVFGVFGDGNYRLQPIYVEDFAELAVQQGLDPEKRNTNVIINAIGPETFTYRELVDAIATAVLGKTRPCVAIPDWFGFAFGKLLGTILGDLVITREEIEGLKSNLLYVEDQPAGSTKLTEWMRENAKTLGKRYASELARRRLQETGFRLQEKAKPNDAGKEASAKPIKTLTREDIVGQRIRKIWQTPWKDSRSTQEELWSCSDPILELENGFAFALHCLCLDAFEELPIEAFDLAVTEKIPVESDWIQKSHGRKIIEVLASKHDPTIVILLDDWSCITTDATPFNVYGPTVYDYTERYTLEDVTNRDVVTYWGHHEAPWPESPSE